jgi:hypothetical protein
MAEEEKGRAEEDRKVLEEKLAALRKREGEVAREREQRDQEEERELRRKAEESLKAIQADREAAEASLREADARERRALEEVTRVQEKEASRNPVHPPSSSEVAAARLDRVEGEVYVTTRAGRRVATPGQDLLGGEGVVSAGARSFAVLSYADKSRLELSGDATVRDLFEGDPTAAKGKRAFIEKGSVKADIAAQPKGQPMVLATPQAESRILGTTFRLTVDSDPKKGTTLEVEEGRIELRTVSGKTVDVGAGRMAVATTGAAPVVRALPKEEVLLSLDFEDGKPSPLVSMGFVEKGPDHAGSRFCLSGIPDPGGVCKLFIGADAQGLFTVQGDEVLSFDYWADPQAGQVNFNFYSRSRGQTFEGVVPKGVFGKWAHATIRLADLGAPDRRLHEEDWVVGLYMQAVGTAANAKRFYVDNLQVTRSRVLKPRPSEAKK